MVNSRDVYGTPSIYIKCNIFLFFFQFSNVAHNSLDVNSSNNWLRITRLCTLYYVYSGFN